MKLKFFIFCSFIIFLISCSKQVKHQVVRGEIAEKGMVVTAHPEATKIGLDILKKGGNAVDAAVAIQFGLAVCYPTAGNIGGGGFMVIRFNNGDVDAIDYRETAPSKGYKDMYLDETGNVIDGLSTYNHLAVGVPGTVDGVTKAHKKYGKLSFKEVIQPAIDMARNGFSLTGNQARNLNYHKEAFLKINSVQPAYVNDSTWHMGDILVLEDLANTLELIRNQGRDGFYSGTTADKIVEEMKRGGGLITHEDLANYSTIWRDPIIGNYKDYKIISMSPPSSGGILLVQLLKMVESYPISKWGWNVPKTVHLMVEAERRVYADRAKHLGDSDHYPVPVEGLLDEQYIHDRMNDFSPEKANLSSEIQYGIPLGYESEETTHFSIVDQFGNAVAVTTTLNRGYGTKIVVDRAGFILNNIMDDFSAKPGAPNSYGLVGGEANSIQPDKRMLSSMTPTIIEKNGDLYMVLGSPGGSTIITSVFQTILNVVEHNMNMQEAVNAGRFHHQWLPNVISYEKTAIDSLAIMQLQKMGHEMKIRSSIGRVDAILILPDGKLEGGADPRGDDKAMGLNKIEK